MFGRLYEWLAHESDDAAYEPLRDIIRDTMPFVLAMLVALAIITFVPDTVNFATITTIVGGTVGGYITYAGAHRYLDSGQTGVEHVRAGQAGRRIIEAAQDMRATAVVMGLPRRVSGYSVFGKTLETVLAERPCRVIIQSDPVKGPISKRPITVLG